MAASPKEILLQILIDGKPHSFRELFYSIRALIPPERAARNARNNDSPLEARLTRGYRKVAWSYVRHYAHRISGFGDEGMWQATVRCCERCQRRFVMGMSNRGEAKLCAVCMPRRNTVVVPPQACRGCGKSFVPDKSPRRFCSRQCSQDHAPRRYPLDMLEKLWERYVALPRMGPRRSIGPLAAEFGLTKAQVKHALWRYQQRRARLKLRCPDVA